MLALLHKWVVVYVMLPRLQDRLLRGDLTLSCKSTPLGAAREHSAVAALARLLGGVPEGVARATAMLQHGLAAVQVAGKLVFAGLRALGWPGTPLGDLWRACGLYREHRGDAPITSWTSVRLHGCEACIINDLYQGLRLGSYVRTRGWSAQEVDTTLAALRQRGWLEGER
jgi:hypothetical protein